MSDTLRGRFRREMLVRGLAKKTRNSYESNVRMLVERTKKHPTKLTTEDLRDYFAWLIDDHGVAAATYRQHLAAVKLFYHAVLGREEKFFVHATPAKRKKLPEVLTVDETQRMLKAIRVPRIRSAATVVYSCGLRKNEIETLSVNWITAESGSLHIHNGKGGLDRIVPLPERTLQILRDHWRRERPSGNIVFESPHARSRGRALSGESIRKALKAAAEAVGIRRRVCLHTLRHCYASHLLERGVPLPLIQRWLGHKSISTTMVYAHITPQSLQHARDVLTELMRIL